MNAFLLRFQESIGYAQPLERKTFRHDPHNSDTRSGRSSPTLTAGTKTLTEVRAEAADPDFSISLYLAVPHNPY